MDSAALIELALQNLACTQKELALRLGVSPTQITKWKKGEYMSQEQEERIRTLAKIDEQDPSFILWSGSPEDARRWEQLIRSLAERAIEDAETGYDTVPLQDQEGSLCWQVVHTLEGMGVEKPGRFPEDLIVDDDNDEFWDRIRGNPHAAAISQIFDALNDTYGFYAAFVLELIHDDDVADLQIMELGMEIDACLMQLAATKIDVDEKFAPAFMQFRFQVNRRYEEWLTALKAHAFKSGRPLRAELLDMVHDSAGELGQSAEAESLGFTASRLHPDIYMNELLQGMRVIHQVLPAIMNKLGISPEEFELDPSELHLG